ncbi:MAG: alpha/beta fold hydrolase [Sphingomicrobium sp.]
MVSAMTMAAVLAAALPATASELTAPGPEAALHATLLKPAGKARATMIIIPGSGPTDRDGNNPMGVAGGPYRKLAEALAERHIATVRIDKRGMFASKAAIPDANKVRIADYAADTARWIAAARKATGARCVWLAGHSEGGLVALASSATPHVCGLVLIATLGRPMGTVIREQLKANPANAPILAPALAAIDQLEAGKHLDVAGLHPALQQLFAPQVQDFLIDSFRIDPAKLLSTYRGQVLIVQGDRDLQVGMADAKRLAAADPRATLVVIAGANHVLRAVPANDRAANFASYAKTDAPLAPGIADAIASFVLRAPGK